MTNHICVTCGVQHAASADPPALCKICTDERQYVGYGGQQWTTLLELAHDHRNRIEELEPNLWGIGTQPSFAIGQRALLVRTPKGNLLWDCVSLLDDATVKAVEALGGIRAVAISHPHFYSSMVEWAHAFACPVYLHAADEAHVMRPDPALTFVTAERTPLFGGLTLIRAGGHFAGASVLHWQGGAASRGALLTSDTITVVADRRYVSFMYSYPNLIPLSAAEVQRVVAAVEPFAFDRIYGGWWHSFIEAGAKEAVRRSAKRYTAHLL